MTRNAKTYSIFDNSITFDMKDGFPLLTTKRMFWKGIVEELLFFIRGDTNSKHLEDKGVKFGKEILLKNLSIILDYHIRKVIWDQCRIYVETFWCRLY